MTSTYSDIDRKIENTTEGLPSECFNYLAKRVLPVSGENVLSICNYISSLKSEINPSRELNELLSIYAGLHLPMKAASPTPQ